jgi:hypothetical protein
MHSFQVKVIIQVSVTSYRIPVYQFEARYLLHLSVFPTGYPPPTTSQREGNKKPPFTSGLIKFRLSISALEIQHSIFDIGISLFHSSFFISHFSFPFGLSAGATV